MVATSSTARQRRYRARRRAGRRVIMLEIDDVEVTAVLESLNFLNPEKSDDEKAIEGALHDMLAVLCRALVGDA